ncbi:lanthionine synthetase C family protein [Corallococcus sp. AS-1-6]|uniref:lanthionine synthetase C family protein n=1 Tax=Corallococcus sp. AS-1-6 TaxID=2874599 RepID=UPI001CBCE808|nr:lanthionine synthetase C family protein [Corallococcus sp. AS-1-6]MBZ4373594.1 lanthionine synthetase C family protein [Corallococcus sp. AS-1-6]
MSTLTARAPQDEVPPRAAPEADPLHRALQDLARDMLATLDTTRSDRLFPQDAMGFQTNPLNLAYGACGPALFLHSVLGELPPPVRDWLAAQPVDLANYPPSLYSGLAGIAWTFAEVGLLERGRELFAMAMESPLALRAVDMFDGAAGWGMAALALHLRTRDASDLEHAVRAGQYLLKRAERSNHGVSWRNDFDGAVRLGFGLGNSGAAFFLLSLWRATGERKYLDTAREGLAFDVAHGQPQGDNLVWGTTAGAEGHRPYWLRGGAGVTSTLIRFFQVLQDEQYLHLARRGARPCGAFFSAAPHLFEGLASMGETLLDMHRVTGERHYLDLARQKAEQCLLYRIERPQGLAFPGRYLMRISHDYGVGGAGIGLFLHRVLTLQPRKFHDLPLATPHRD